MQVDGTTFCRACSKAEVEGSASLTVSSVARVWLARGRGQTGPWARTTRERYERVIRQHIDASTDATMGAIGDVTLPELTVDVVADWSAANVRHLARTTASLALLTLRQVCRFGVRGRWVTVNPVTQLEPAEKPRWRPGHVAALERLLISQGLNVLFVSRQVGHANPNVTLEVYAHEFARREHGQRARVALEAAYAEMVAAGRRQPVRRCRPCWARKNPGGRPAGVLAKGGRRLWAGAPSDLGGQRGSCPASWSGWPCTGKSCCC